jgi:hypothetical protein
MVMPPNLTFQEKKKELNVYAATYFTQRFTVSLNGKHCAVVTQLGFSLVSFNEGNFMMYLSHFDLILFS